MALINSEIFVDISAELLQEGYSVRFRPGGASMFPTIKDGETVTVEQVKPTDVKRGDIILYKTDHRVIAHRVVSVQKKGGNSSSFILRGDASASCDEPVGADQILGKVVSVERDGRSIDLTSSYDVASFLRGFFTLIFKLSSNKIPPSKW